MADRLWIVMARTTERRWFLVEGGVYALKRSADEHARDYRSLSPFSLQCETKVVPYVPERKPKKVRRG